MKKVKKTRKNPALDLLGGVIITFDEVELWLDIVAKLPRDSPRRRYYCESWDVYGKIKAAKLDGTFNRLMER